ncbi:MAG TPA: zinc ribbon domain-containing protein, partial [Gemmatimonadaceae bacterium]|nr:zinc ribbon domain-containing protein [Gemmatimonadaceae bacterium]
SAASLAIAPPAAPAGGVAGSGAVVPPASPVAAADAAPTTEAAEQGAGGDAPLVSGEPARDVTDAEHFDELAFLRDVTGVTPAQSIAPPAEAEGTPSAASPERPVNDALGLVLPSDAPAITAPRRASTEAPLGTAPTVTKPEVGRQGKTLKCTDCGSLNYPTEWYCERCGAELSAL